MKQTQTPHREGIGKALVEVRVAGANEHRKNLWTGSPRLSW